MTTTPPTTPGPYRFDGIRRAHNRGEIAQVKAIVEVRRVFHGREPGLGVAQFGKARIYPIGDFEGTWTLLEVDDLEG